MSDYILNLLPVNEAEKQEFEAIAPEAVHVYAGRRTVTPEQLEQATVLAARWPSTCSPVCWPCAAGCPPIGTPSGTTSGRTRGP